VWKNLTDKCESNLIIDVIQESGAILRMIFITRILFMKPLSGFLFVMKLLFSHYTSLNVTVFKADLILMPKA
jgi:hypothetical protein